MNHIELCKLLTKKQTINNYLDNSSWERINAVVYRYTIILSLVLPKIFALKMSSVFYVRDTYLSVLRITFDHRGKHYEP